MKLKIVHSDWAANARIYNATNVFARPKWAKEELIICLLHHIVNFEMPPGKTVKISASCLGYQVREAQFDDKSLK